MKNEKLKDAFGIKEGYTAGSSFNADFQANKKEAEKAEKELKKKEYEKSLRRCVLCFVIFQVFGVVLIKYCVAHH